MSHPVARDPDYYRMLEDDAHDAHDAIRQWAFGSDDLPLRARYLSPSSPESGLVRNGGQLTTTGLGAAGPHLLRVESPGADATQPGA